MQRILNNLLTVAMIGLLSTSASLAMAKGGGKGGGKSGGGKGGSSHKSGHKSGHKSSHKSSHKSGKSHSHHGTHKTSHTQHSHSHSHSHHGYHDHHYRGWHGHKHYPVGFWFGGNYGVVETGVVETGVISTGVIGTGVVSTPVPVAGIDVEFTKIEQLDAGDPENNVAPTYRVSFHNNSDVDITQPFDVAILAANDDKLVEGLPSASVQVDSLAADETTSVDIQLPAAAMTMGTDDGKPAAFSYVHTIIDSQNDLVETDKTNNLSVDSCDDIPAVADVATAE